MEGCGTSSGLDVPNGNGCHLGVTGHSGGSDNRGAVQGKTYKTTCISKKDYLTFLRAKFKRDKTYDNQTREIQQNQRTT